MNFLFQLTRSRGAWRGKNMKFPQRGKFQLTRSRGAWRSCDTFGGKTCKFQLTRLRGAWHRSCCHSHRRRHFNSHAHVERDVSWFLKERWWNNFNSHAHVERDCCGFYIKQPFNISTHTLTWSVTLQSDTFHNDLVISTHTLTWSVTFSIHSAFFQLAISTHTLTWSVTQCASRK